MRKEWQRGRHSLRTFNKKRFVWCNPRYDVSDPVTYLLSDGYVEFERFE